MDDQRLSLADADSPDDVKRVLEFFGRRLLGEQPQYPVLSSQITTRDALLITDIMLDVLRRAADDSGAVLQLEADILVKLASVGIYHEHHR